MYQLNNKIIQTRYVMDLLQLVQFLRMHPQLYSSEKMVLKGRFMEVFSYCWSQIFRSPNANAPPDAKSIVSQQQRDALSQYRMKK